MYYNYLPVGYGGAAVPHSYRLSPNFKYLNSNQIEIFKGRFIV